MKAMMKFRSQFVAVVSSHVSFHGLPMVLPCFLLDERGRIPYHG